ncbi:adenylate/guanylate cyclase domain-containing protein [Chryseobacterium luquanense]|uniref:Tetratricopeptide repeat protein n=1 Tax=Chryseobacterium luquanense TaxID=2983766 RepID=A0ABT3Y767_9FLAO|nr:adenylate/guanylate cyclase domain-containing protein [Chryseobacterium luquanense]MCX8533994.1 tetratricopeptide repeat protein [Chryseobacterium luquanense]
MKNKFTSFAIVCFFFCGNNGFKAQDSREILDLKNKLLSAKSDREKAKFYDDLGNKYADSKIIDSALAYSKLGLPIYEKLNNTEQIGRSNIFIGGLLLQKMDFVNSERYLVEGERYLNKTENYDKRAWAYYLLATINSVNKKNKVANDYCNQILSLYHQKKIKDKKVVLTAYQRLFQNNFLQENPVEGYKSLNTYIEFTQNNFPEYLYDAYLFAGTFYLSNKDFKKSLNYYQKSLEVAKKNKNEQQVANSKMFIGNIYSETKQYEKAKPFLNDAKDYFEEHQLNNDLKMLYYYFSDIYYNQKDYNNAQFYINKTLRLSNEQDPMYRYFTHQKGLIDLKAIMHDEKDFKKERKTQELQRLTNEQSKNLDYFLSLKTIVPSEIFIQNYKILQEAYEQLGDYEKSLFYLKKANDENEKTYGLDKMRNLAETQSKSEIASERLKVKLEEENKRIQLQKEIELKALRFEYEKKQAVAKTEEERKRLALEEDLKRKEIQIKFEEEQKAVALKYNQEKNIARLNQEKKDAIAKADLESSKTEKNMWAVGAGLSLLLLGFAGFSYNQKRKDNKKIAEEKQKSDDLLLNILPFEVAEELKEKGKTSAKHFDMVSVLFTDFVNFTANSERIGVQEVLNELNICFTEFDRIMEKYNLEKIKTIGDAYLAVSGLPVSNDQHAKNAVNASLEILSYIQQRKIDNPNALDIRIGIHSGPVIAGIVGVKKFAYDIWGDTVNTAARMEQNSVLGKLNVSEATYQLIKEDFTFEYRGKIETKGKGALEMYFVNS